jgi:SAM-dependent methyltransferase
LRWLEKMAPENLDRMRDRTIDDFSVQWTKYTEDAGYHGSAAWVQDLLGDLFQLSELKGKRVADIGSGIGRIVNIILDAGAAHVIAVEPSRGFDALRRNTAPRVDRITYLNAPGDALPADADIDYCLSIQVLHHIPDPHPVVKAAYRALRPGGRMVIWLYGKEGNASYLVAVGSLRKVTVHLPRWALVAVSQLLLWATDIYGALCRIFPLPLRDYMLNSFSKFTRQSRRLVIFDQLNPAWAKYYTRDEAHALLADAGFVDVRLSHHRGYSWAVIGAKPGG